MNNAVRHSSPQAAPSSSHRPSHVSSATVIQLSAGPGRKADSAPARSRSRRRDLVFGGVLAVILLIACLTWEVLRDGEAPHTALDDARHGATPAAVR